MKIFKRFNSVNRIISEGGCKVKGSLLRTDEELSEIYKRHVKTVYRVCFMYMKNPHDTEDMVQNTFIRLMQEKTHFQNFEHEKAWLIRTATNLCKDFFRSWWTKTIGMYDAGEISVEGDFIIDETLRKVMELPLKYKTAVYMYYYEGYSTAEIAKILNKNDSTIRGYLHSARKLLRIEIEGDLK